MAKGVRSKTRKKNNSAKRAKLEKSELQRNVRLAAKMAEIRTSNIFQDMAETVPISHDETMVAKVKVRVESSSTTEMDIDGKTKLKGITKTKKQKRLLRSKFRS